MFYNPFLKRKKVNYLVSCDGAVAIATGNKTCDRRSILFQKSCLLSVATYFNSPECFEGGLNVSKSAATLSTPRVFRYIKYHCARLLSWAVQEARQALLLVCKLKLLKTNFVYFHLCEKYSILDI